jgi:hypothetical protein
MTTHTTPRQFADVEIVALAWLVNGEGYVALTSDYNRAKYPGVSQFRLELVINMVDPVPLRFIHRIFGGRLKPYKASQENANDFWRLRWSPEQSVEILKLIYPHLQGQKKRQAALAFKYKKIAVQARWKRDSHRFKLLLEIVRQMRELTNRGRNPKAVETVRPDLVATNETKIQSELGGNIEKKNGDVLL